MNILAEILSSKIRAEIFRMLFGLNVEELHMREIERRSGLAIGTVQTELKKLLQLDLVKKRRDGNRVYFGANTEHPLFGDIQNLVIKTCGLADVLRESLSPHKGILTAFVFGSLGRDEARAKSDVDLLIVGDIGLREVSRLLSGVSEKIGREINPNVFTPEEIKKRISNSEPFISRVLSEPRLYIIGSENDLGSMG
jgi:DNA-binding transcriptional ArsR family regulator